MNSTLYINSFVIVVCIVQRSCIRGNFFCGVSFWYVNKQVFRRKDLFQKLTIFVEVKPPIWTNGSKISEKMQR